MFPARGKNSLLLGVVTLAVSISFPLEVLDPETSADCFLAGSPGADRVVFNQNCDYAGSITHTGASGNNFVGCSDTS